MRSIPSALLGIGLLTASLQAQQLQFDFSGSSVLSDFGAAVAVLGDLNGDGAPELAVGAPQEDFNGDLSGSVFVLSSADGAQLFRFDGDGLSTRFGFSVAGPGDVDGDGTPDILVGAKRTDDTGMPSGYAQVHSGTDGSILFTFRTTHRWDRFGHAVAAAGDVDADGYADLLVTAPEDDWQGPGSGSVRIFSGFDGSILHTLYGRDPWDRFGWCATGVGDADGDGHDDFAVGSPLADRSGVQGGAATVFSGRTGALLMEFVGARDNGLGTSMSGAADVNGDGLPDLAVGAVNTSSSQTARQGYVEVYSLGSGTRLYRIVQSNSLEAFGTSVAANGDVTGDGYSDILVGAPFAGDVLTSGFASGQARLFLGINGRFLAEVEGSATLDKLGSSMTMLGDTNQDGFGDYLIGVPGGNPNGNARLYLGDPLPLLELANFVAGQTGTLRVSGAVPFSTVSFYYSLSGLGSGSFGGVSLDLADTVKPVGTATADAAGAASVSFPIPASAQGRLVAFQSTSAGVLSAPLQDTVQ